MHVVYSEAMVAPRQGYSPSAGKPRAVMEAWTQRWPTLTRVPVQPVTLEDLYRAHDRHYVDGVMEQRLPNGFGTRSAAVAQSLPYTSGALLTAARLALSSGEPVAAPVSGFHHASWGEGLVISSRILDGEETLDVAFESVGIKRLIASLAKLEVISS